MRPDTRPGGAELHHIFSAHPSGVVAVCGVLDQEPIGMVVSTFTPVSLSPPIVSICIQKTSTTWPVLATLLRVGVSILGDDQEEQCRRLAALPATERFTDVPWQQTLDGAVMILGASTTFECTLMSQIEAGDHLIVLFTLHDAHDDTDREPLVLCRSRYQRLAPR